MCGIAGIFSRQPVRLHDIARMTAAVESRGPDDWGHLLIDIRGQLAPLRSQAGAGDEGASDIGSYNLALGHRRLSIIDLSSLGHQPMAFADLAVTYNGEIYNYIELREELCRLGHHFQSRSDTEVLLHAYTEWGNACLGKLNGIFAFALWDGRRQQLLLARDRLGVKPLYYTYDSSHFFFCSEIKGLLAICRSPRRLNDVLVYHYLTSGRLDHTSDTFFEGIQRLPAGTRMAVTEKGNRIETYWEAKAESLGSRADGSRVEQFRTLFQDAIRLQMRSDVTVGSCLSGGLDSSSVVSAASAQSPVPMKTFTARFSDREMDEWRYVREIAKHKGVQLHSVFVEPSGFWSDLSSVVRAQEEPFGGPGVYAQWRLMQLIHSQGIRVVLDGQGGDELLCGYAKYFYFALQDLWRGRAIGQFFMGLIDGLFHGGPQLLDLSGAKRYLPRAFGALESRRILLQPAFVNGCRNVMVEQPAGDVSSQQLLDVTKFSLPILLRYEDKNSMAFSIEARVPFLDHRLVEFALGLPTEFKIRGSESKWILRRALHGLVPDMILDRRSKLGFGGTYRSWVAALNSPLSEWISSPTRPVDRFIKRKHLSRFVENRDPFVFRPLILDTWMREFQVE